MFQGFFGKFVPSNPEPREAHAVSEGTKARAQSVNGSEVRILEQTMINLSQSGWRPGMTVHGWQTFIPSEEGNSCTLTGTNHWTDSCSQGYSCIVANKDPNQATWNGTCKAWVDGVDFCSGTTACYLHNGPGWTCSDDRDCQGPAPSPSPCAQQYFNCAQECLNRPSNLSAGDLDGSICASLPPKSAADGAALSHAKDYYCRYGECKNDRNCTADPSHTDYPFCKDNDQIGKVAAHYQCNLPINNPPYSDPTDPATDAQCKPAGNYWDDELFYNYSDFFSFLMSANMSVVYAKEFSDTFDHLGHHLPGLNCILSCTLAPYVH